MKNSLVKTLVRICLNAFLIAALALLARPAQAVGLTPDHYVIYSHGHDLGDCSSTGTACATINYAISKADSGDTIHIGPGTFEPVYMSVVKDLNFRGDGMDTTFIDGDGTTRAFNMLANATVIIGHLTIRNGTTGASGCGGGIAQNSGMLSLVEVRVANNTADCGAGISSYGSMIILRSEISNNHATAVSSSRGGGISLQGTGSTYTLKDVTISGNTANASGGGLEIRNASSTTLTNVTISGNTGTHGALIVNNSAQVTIINSTIANNHATLSGYSGGIASQSTVVIKNSIVAGNDGSNCSILIGSSWTSQGNNIDSGASCQFSSVALNDHQNTDPRLGSLANNGGLTQTMALLPGSPAIDGVTFNAPNGCPGTDQRGISRPFGPRCDIGAYEYNANALFLPFILR